MRHDPVASLKLWPTVITLGDQEYTLPGHPSATWLTILLEQPIKVMDIVPGLMASDDQLQVLDSIADGDIPLDELEKVALEVITTVSGRDWWWTLRMLSVLAEAWSILYGPMVGLDLEKLPLAAFLDKLYFTCAERLEQDKKQMFDLELESIPEGVEVEFDEDAEGQAFLKMMQQAQSL